MIERRMLVVWEMEEKEQKKMQLRETHPGGRPKEDGGPVGRWWISLDGGRKGRSPGCGMIITLIGRGQELNRWKNRALFASSMKISHTDEYGRRY